MVVVKSAKEWEEQGFYLSTRGGELETAFYIFEELQQTLIEHLPCASTLLYFIIKYSKRCSEGWQRPHLIQFGKQTLREAK